MEFLFAQISPVSTDTFQSPSVWLQGGSFLLVVYLVVWAYPKAMKEQREERESRDLRFQAMVDVMHERFSERNEKIVEAIEKQTSDFREALETSADQIVFSVDRSCRHTPLKGAT